MTTARQAGRPATFQQLLNADAPLPLGRTLALIRAAALAIDALHARQQVHGAIVPCVFQIDGDDQVTLRPAVATDARGPSQAPSASQTAPEPSTAEREHWSPQRHAGEPARPMDDLYALASIGYALLGGHRSPEGLPGAATEPAWHAEGADTSDVASALPLPVEIERVLRAQLSWAPSERFATGAELAHELERAARRPAGSRGTGRSSAGTREPLEPHGLARLVSEDLHVGDEQWLQEREPSWEAARRAAQAREARRLALASLTDRRGRTLVRPVPPDRGGASRPDYPDMALAGGWVTVLVVVLCSVYLFPLYFMLFSHG